jgi:hypothetical protein
VGVASEPKICGFFGAQLEVLVHVFFVFTKNSAAAFFSEAGKASPSLCLEIFLRSFLRV